MVHRNSSIEPRTTPPTLPSLRRLLYSAGCLRIRLAAVGSLAVLEADTDCSDPRLGSGFGPAAGRLVAVAGRLVAVAGSTAGVGRAVEVGSGCMRGVGRLVE
jgi:hypothetical protein